MCGGTIMMGWSDCDAGDRVFWKAEFAATPPEWLRSWWVKVER